MTDIADLKADLENEDPKVRKLAGEILKMKRELKSLLDSDDTVSEHITNEMTQFARAGNKAAVAECLHILHPMVEVANTVLSNRILETVDKAVRTVQRNAR